MRIQAVHLHRVAMPLVSPFRTSFGTQTVRDILLVQVETSDGAGWGECVALAAPVYSSEYVDGAQDVLERELIPRVLAAPETTVAEATQRMEPVRGHPMAKAALETALLDAELRAANMSLASYLGASRGAVEVGVSVGITDSIGEVLDVVAGHLDEGYRRVKLKIEPGWDIEVVAAVRERFGDIALQADANAAYTLSDARHLAKLDAFDLLLVEQPLAEDDIGGHAALARQMRTPICLDESITSARVAAHAISIGACSIVNVKPGRVGGYLEARRIHDLCAAHGLAVWCGGMLESGIGRAANLALAALPGFTLPGDISASGRYYATDITEPFVLDDGHINVPTGPGIGVTPLPDLLAAATTSRKTVTS